MLKRKYRLRHRHDINRVYKRARRANTETLTVRALPNQVGHPRVAVVVSAKVAKRAVKRNRMRRRIFGLMEQYVDALGAHDVIVSLKRDVSELPAEKLQAQITQALTKR